ncbi:DHA2 family efflux MFS transporter permease subunit [Thermoleophilum album]|uniref:Drug resistance transporter, EmrB/QacA subfamily n=1 Tax=Thermoleophilum album TaxID=29539 RepID=A0A1H6FHW2_THEAL|nr:DHA2 family efflux MFS transporter permease subunit [Thermoleophilum album]SEH10421.1 drug resistance transporter, EmrB/QacA subfamily [Thermoleophilum album]
MSELSVNGYGGAPPVTDVGGEPRHAERGDGWHDKPDHVDRRLLALASVVVVGAFMSILDTTIVNVAIRTLAEEFSSPLTTIQWVATAYTLALATVIPISGWASERFGTKRLYVGSVALFALGSALCGLAWSDTSLIAFRILQGLGGGLIMPVGMTILTRAAGPHRLGRVMSIVGVPMLIAPIVGPILGGWLVDHASWHWIFLINVPVGIVAVAMALAILPTDRPQPLHRLDLPGLLVLSPGLALIIYGLAESGSQGGFGHAKVLVPLAIGLALLAYFVRHGLRASDPLVDLRLYKNRAFSAATATLFAFVIAVFGGFFLVPLYLQAVRGEDAFHTGLLLIPQGVGAMLAMPLAGQLADRIATRKLVFAGTPLVFTAFAVFTQLAADTPYALVCGALFVMGLGMGLSMMPLFTGAMQTLQKRSVARASTQLNITQQVAASFGTALLSVALANAIRERLGPAAAGGRIGGEGAAQIPPEMRERVAALLADAFGSAFTWSLALVVVAFLVAWLLPRRRPTVSDAQTADERRPAEPLVVP